MLLVVLVTFDDCKSDFLGDFTGTLALDDDVPPLEHDDELDDSIDDADDFLDEPVEEELINVLLTASPFNKLCPWWDEFLSKVNSNDSRILVTLAMSSNDADAEADVDELVDVELLWIKSSKVAYMESICLVYASPWFPNSVYHQDKNTNKNRGTMVNDLYNFTI